VDTHDLRTAPSDESPHGNPPAIAGTLDEHEGCNTTGRLIRDARLLRHHLGTRFVKLHADIANRFAHTEREESLHFTGNMTRVHSSMAGWMLAQLTRFSGLLPTRRGHDVPFEFNIRPLGLGWLKHRCYHFPTGRFDFRSEMRPDGQGRLVERFRGGLGMYLALEGSGDDLIFRDRGYFLHYRGLDVPLPGWCHPGRFELVHKTLDRHRFSVHLTLRHWLFGSMIEQAGEFTSLSNQ